MLFAVVSVGCGRSECQDYAAVFCSKYSACVSPAPSEDAMRQCEREGMRQIEAQRRTEEDCHAARLRFQDMTCADFRAFIAAVAR